MQIYSGSFCRLRLSLQPLYDACLHLRSHGGAAYWHDHLGTYWRGINTTACVHAPRGQVKNESVCRHDSRQFTAYDHRWLDIARPLMGLELRQLPEGERLASQALGGAPSLDRLLLLLARLTCLSLDAADDAGSVGGSGRRAVVSAGVLVVGGGPVGLMTAVQARLAGAPTSVWEKRDIRHRTRDNVVDASESDRSDPEHPGALTLMENIGLLHLGMRGMWVRPRFLRATKVTVGQYAHTPAYQVPLLPPHTPAYKVPLLPGLCAHSPDSCLQAPSS